MIEYLAIIAIALAQIGLLFWLDERSFKLPKIWILVGLLTAQLFIFPKVALAIYGFNDTQCGMPIIGLHLFFLILGGGLNLIAHFTYYFIKRNKIKHKL